MSSRTVGKSFRAWARGVLLGLFLLLLSMYVLLATGFLGEAPGRIISAIASNDSMSIEFRGLRTDLFWSTSADSVIVSGKDGLMVVVSGADIDGSVLDYLFNGHVDAVTVESLGISIPVLPEIQGSPPDSLIEILRNIDIGIAVSTDRLVLDFGTIDYEGSTIIDSMFIDCSVDRMAGVLLQVDSAGIFLPGFGSIRGGGLLMMSDGVVSTEGFTAVAQPGSLTVSGSLAGKEENLDLLLSGHVSTLSLDLPVRLSFMLEGSLRGNLSDLQAVLGLSGGEAALFGMEVSFSADTLTADLNGVSVKGLAVSTEDVTLNLDGDLDLSTMAWNAGLFMRMSRMDLSRYLVSAVPTELSGDISADIRGTGSTGLGGSATVDLSASSSSIAQVSGMHLEAALSGDEFNLGGNFSTGGGSVTFSGNGNLGPGWVPQSWNFRADGSVTDFSFIRLFSSGRLPDISSGWFSIAGTGSRFGMNLQGSAGVRGISSDAFSADRVTMRGTVNYSPRGASGGVPVGMGFRGTVDAIGLHTEGVSADTANFEGSFRMSGRSTTMEASLRVDSLRLASQVFHTEAGIEMEGNDITVSDLILTGSGDRQYTADIHVSLGDTTFVELQDLRATHSKLRLITDGGLSIHAFEETVVLDTLWLDPPIGNLGVSGILSPERLGFQAEIVNVDLTSISTFSGLPADMSGVGNFRISYFRDSTGVVGFFTGKISDPAYGQFNMDSITVDISSVNDDLNFNGIYAWQNGVRSGLQLRAVDVWNSSEISLLWDKIQWFELEVNNIGDWLFYVLPLPVRTMGASVSARIEYERFGGDYQLQMQASARINRLYITILGIELLNVNFYLSYPDSSAEGYNTRFTLGSGSLETGNFSSTWRADIRSMFPFKLGDYMIESTLTDMEIAIPGIGAVICSGDLGTEGTGLLRRPLLTGKLRVREGAVGIPQPVAASSGSGSGEMPFDISIDVSGTGDIWFRTSFADIEMSMKLRIFTLERKPTVNGTVSAVRGRITLLQRDFQITSGTVTIIQGHPPEMQLNVEAVTHVRSALSHQEFEITVLIHGSAENPEITLTGVGPAGPITQEDILTLLAAGLTYGEMQQMNSSSIRSEVQNVAQSMLGNLLARNLRHEMGLDTFEISPELLSDTTSLVLNVGKYVLPDLYVSYKDDVFSGEPGTVSAQYQFSNDFYVEGSSRTTIHGYLEPTVELHYTIRY